MRASGALLRQRRLAASSIRHCVRYCIGELPTSCWKRSASTDRDVLAASRQFLQRPGVGRARVQRVQRRADDAIAHAGEPSGAAGALLVHVQAQHFDEQHLGELREHTGAARPRRARLGQRIAHGGFEPRAGVRAAHVDPHDRRQPREQHPREARIAGEIAADEARRAARRRRTRSGADGAPALHRGACPWPAGARVPSTSDARRPAER